LSRAVEFLSNIVASHSCTEATLLDNEAAQQSLLLDKDEFLNFNFLLVDQ